MNCIYILNYRNGLSPVIPIQSNTFESYIIDMSYSQYEVNNATYVINPVFNPPCSQLNVTSQQFIYTKKFVQNNGNFCPIYEWQPLYQPVYFYLSPDSIDLVIYNITSEDVQQVEQIIHNDLTLIVSSIQCYSIFPINNEIQFAVDCNGTVQGELTKMILTFDLINDQETLIISNFTLNTVSYYQYENGLMDQYINNCRYRITQPFKLINYNNTLSVKYIQYCPEDEDQQIYFNNFFIIYDFTQISPQNYSLMAFQGNSSEIADTNQFYSIKHIFINQMVLRFDQDTWNIGIIFSGKQGLYKFQFNISTENEAIWNYTYTFLEIFEPNYIRSIYNQNQDFVLIFWNNFALYLIYFEQSWKDNNYQLLNFKNIYQEGYYVIDIIVTINYFVVILSQQDQNIQSNRRFMCFNNSSNFSNETNILKVYQNLEKNENVYFQQSINSIQQFLQPSSTNVKDQFTLFNIANNTELILEIYQITQKQISFVYQNENLSDISYYCSNLVAQPYFQILVEYYVMGLNSFNSTQYLVICLNQANYQQAQLLAQAVNVDFNNPNQSATCPKSKDVKEYSNLLNSVSLLDGIIGPLLKIYYIPNSTYNQYYPFYFDYQYKIPLSEFLQLFNKPIYLIYRSVVEDIQEKFDIFSTLFILLTLEEDPIQINQIKCAITSLQNSGEKGKLSLSYCERSPYFKVNLLQKVDQMKQLDSYQFYSQFDTNSTQIVICIEKECYFINGIFNQMQTKQLDITYGPQMNQDQYFSLTFLEINSSKILFFSFKIQIQTSVQESPIIATIYNSFSREQLIIYSFKYTFITEEYLVVGFSNGLFQSIVKGSIQSYEQPIFSNFSITMYTQNFEICHNCKFGFFIVSASRIKIGQKFIIYWSSNSTFSQISEWISFGNTYDKFWRNLPLYGYLISNKSEMFVSGVSLYVPIITDYPLEITYLVYNLLDYSGGMLIDSFNISITNQDEKIFTMPVENYYDILQNSKEVSFALVATNRELFIYYLNSDPQFTFKLADQKDLSNSLTLLIAQQFSIPIFRNYTIFFNFTATNIKTPPNSNISIEIDSNNAYLQLEGGYYIYMFLIGNSNFSGPICNYNYQFKNAQANIYPYNYKINNTEVVVYPSPYLQLEKYLGDYMTTINQYGLITQLISYDNQMYASLFKMELSPLPHQYNDLILVLTNNYLLFYQKQSNKSNNNFENCNYDNYTQNEAGGECLLRMIKRVSLNIENANALTCRMQLNGLAYILIYCQTINHQHIKQDTQQSFFIIEFRYFQRENKITIKNQTKSKPQYCYCYFLDLQPFYYEGNVYQVIKHTYYQESTFFAIYLIQSIDDIIQASLQLVLPLSEPLKRSRDFTLLVQPTQLTILILQYFDLVIVTVNLTSWTTIIQQKLKLEEWQQDPQNYQEEFQDKYNKIDYSDLSFVGVLNQTLDSEIQMGLVGKFDFAAEIQINFTSFSFKITHIFVAYLVCQTSLLQKPQFISYDNTVVYLVSLCLTHYFDYTGLQEEMTYIFDEPSTNIMYIMFFIRENEKNYSQPVYMLEPNVINLASLNLLQFQVYYIQELVNQTITRFQPKILITNTTYFLMDYVIYPQQGYYLSIPEEFVMQQDELVMTVEAYNEYSSNSINYVFTWPKTNKINSTLWFYALCLVFGVIIIASLIYYLIHRFQRKEQFEDPEVSEFYKSTLEKSIEMQQPRNKMEESHFDLTLRQIFTKKKD